MSLLLPRSPVKSSIPLNCELNMIIEGKAHVLGDSVDTDGMIAGRYLALSDPKEIAKHIFEESDPSFVKRVRPGDILVAGRNFGAGSGREHAPLGLKALGIGCIVATSFARTFFRMAIDLGLQTVTCPDAVKIAQAGDLVRVDTATGAVQIGSHLFKTEPLPDFIRAIVDGGGLTPWVRAEIEKRQTHG
jgi:3-isopropylmalate/(R)-2-methylmalate dehydratase small subunit